MLFVIAGCLSFLLAWLGLFFSVIALIVPLAFVLHWLVLLVGGLLLRGTIFRHRGVFFIFPLLDRLFLGYLAFGLSHRLNLIFAIDYG